MLSFKSLLFMIIGLALILRVWNVTVPDSYTDEAINAFRSIGLIDYDTSQSQTTPWQWFDQVPWWSHLSFHDHPLISFILEHWSLKIFGNNLFAVRLPSIITGVAVIFLLYAIGKELKDDHLGLIAAGIGAVNSYLLWISRLGLQDGIALTFILLALFSLLKIRRDPRWWIAWSIAVGLGISTKYTTLIVILLTVWFLFLNRFSLVRTKYFWRGIIIIIFLTAPSWMYNIMLYRTTGHFDFQISAFLHQNVPQWSFRMGRTEVGGLRDRLVNFFIALRYSTSLLFLGTVGFAVIWNGVKLRPSNWREKNSLLLGWAMLMWLWFLIIGSTYRFVVMIIPFLILLTAIMFSDWMRQLNWKKNVWIGLFILFTITELIFSWNTFLLRKSWGTKNFTYAKISDETQNYGFNELDEYFDTALKGKIPGLVGEPEYVFLKKILADEREPRLSDGTPRKSVLIIHDASINFLANLWVFQRRLTYEGWPFISLDNFLALNDGKPEEMYREQGIIEFMYIVPLTEVALEPLISHSLYGKQFAEKLEKRGIQPTVIHNHIGQPTFAVYRF